MKSKRMSFSNIFPMLALGVIFILSGCEENKDLYNPDRVQEEARKNFPVKDIDPNQTWETSTVCNATVSVNETAGEVYTIKVYTSNPYNKDEEAFLLAKTTVADGKTVDFKFDIPTALQYVYVMKVNSKGYSSAVPVAVENGSIKVAFGGESPVTRAAMTRASDSFFIPVIPGDEMFPTTVPNGCRSIDDYKEGELGVSYLLENKTYDLKIASGGDFYISGNVTINSWNEPSKITNLYLLPGATLTLGMKQFNHRPNSIFSIGKEAQLIATNTVFKGEEGSQLFNKGTITAQKIEITKAYFYNANKITSGPMVFTNGTSKFCNASGALLTVSELRVAGDGHFLNEINGIVKSTGATILDCNNGSWENAGHYTTSTMEMSAWNNNVKNSCWLTVEQKLTFSETGIYNEGYIFCKDLYMQNTIVNMAINSFFEVDNTATFQDNWENQKGFIAPTTPNTWAMLKMKKAISNNNHNWKDVAYTGHVYIACNDHFPIGTQYNPAYKLENGAQMTGINNADITIPSSECNPGYNSKPDGGGSDKVQTYAYAFEDMEKNAGDYDFNDVVLYVTVPYDKNGEKVIDVTLKAAGASKQLSVSFNDGTKERLIFEDVHAALGVPTGTIVNTGEATGTPKTETVTVSSNFNLTDNGDFYISDGKERKVHIPKFTSDFQPGNVPYAIRIASGAWKWPEERISIEQAYSGFAEWAKDATAEPDWYNNPTSESVMSN